MKGRQWITAAPADATDFDLDCTFLQRFLIRLTDGSLGAYDTGGGTAGDAL
jgi:hypothetical protein